MNKLKFKLILILILIKQYFCSKNLNLKKIFVKNPQNNNIKLKKKIFKESEENNNINKINKNKFLHPVNVHEEDIDDNLSTTDENYDDETNEDEIDEYYSDNDELDNEIIKQNETIMKFNSLQTQNKILMIIMIILMIILIGFNNIKKFFVKTAKDTKYYFKKEKDIFQVDYKPLITKADKEFADFQTKLNGMKNNNKIENNKLSNIKSESQENESNKEIKEEKIIDNPNLKKKHIIHQLINKFSEKNTFSQKNTKEIHLTTTFDQIKQKTLNALGNISYYLPSILKVSKDIKDKTPEYKFFDEFNEFFIKLNTYNNHIDQTNNNENKINQLITNFYNDYLIPKEIPKDNKEKPIDILKEEEIKYEEMVKIMDIINSNNIVDNKFSTTTIIDINDIDINYKNLYKLEFNLSEYIKDDNLLQKIFFFQTIEDDLLQAINNDKFDLNSFKSMKMLEKTVENDQLVQYLLSKLDDNQKKILRHVIDIKKNEFVLFDYLKKTFTTIIQNFEQINVTKFSSYFFNMLTKETEENKKEPENNYSKLIDSLMQEKVDLVSESQKVIVNINNNDENQNDNMLEVFKHNCKQIKLFIEMTEKNDGYYHLLTNINFIKIFNKLMLIDEKSSSIKSNEKSSSIKSIVIGCINDMKNYDINLVKEATKNMDQINCSKNNTIIKVIDINKDVCKQEEDIRIKDLKILILQKNIKEEIKKNFDIDI